MRVLSISVVTDDAKAYRLTARFEVDGGEQGGVRAREWVIYPFPAHNGDAGYRDAVRQAARDIGPELADEAGVTQHEADAAIEAYLAATPNWGG